VDLYIGVDVELSGVGLKATFWGVRGSIPTPGQSTNEWGGNSSCVQVQHGDEFPLVLDCGTGARALGQQLVAKPGRELDLLFTHFHMDHVFGFPFFLPIFTPGYDVRVTVPALSKDEAKNKLGQYLNGVYHPVRLRDVMDNVSFHVFSPGDTLTKGPYTIHTCRLNHPGGAVGYRIETGGQSVAYMTDTSPFARPGEGIAYGTRSPSLERNVIRFLEGADLVIYDTMYEYSEYLTKMSWGHSYPEYAEALCKEAGVGHLVLFHHSPDATDTQLNALNAHWRDRVTPRVSVAKEGCTVNVEG
jgi:phosphoribosyl 1,2-cyclic phosphodiesterase